MYTMDLRNFKSVFATISTAFASLIYTKKRIQKNKLRALHSHDDNAANRLKNN